MLPIRPARYSFRPCLRIYRHTMVLVWGGAFRIHWFWVFSFMWPPIFTLSRLRSSISQLCHCHFFSIFVIPAGVVSCISDFCCLLLYLPAVGVVITRIRFVMLMSCCRRRDLPVWWGGLRTCMLPFMRSATVVFVGHIYGVLLGM